VARVLPLRFITFAIWVVSTLVVAYFHEPWRDEAQAWLVARYSESIVELFFRASIEASGPLYYLWLWPFARIWPDGFPFLHFSLSWMGTALAAWALLSEKRIPAVVRGLFVFGYCLGFEYASVARLYGWGCWFLMRGISADLDGRPRVACAWLMASVSLQLNVALAVIGWVSYRVLVTERIARWWPVFATFALHITLLQWTRQGSPETWHFSTNLTRLGSTLGAPFVQLPGSIGLAGLVIFPLAMSLLSSRARLGLLTALVPFFILYLFRYFGHPQSRHAGLLALVFTVIVGLEWAHLSTRKRQLALLLLSLSFVGGLLGRGQDIFYPFSDGAAVAKAVREDLPGRKPPRLVSDYSYAGITASAILGIPLWVKGDRLSRPFGPTELARSPVHCPAEETCYFVGDKPVGETLYASLGRWELLKEKSKWSVAPENLYLYRLTPNEVR